MAYGAPARGGDLAAYYTHIRRGSAPSPALLSALQQRYQAIGGHSPLLAITQAQAAGLAQQLNARFSNRRFKPYLGFKHSRPSIEDAVAAIHADGIRVVLSAAMAPHDGAGEIQHYHVRAAQAAKRAGGPNLYRLAAWHRAPSFIALWARRIRTALDSLTPEAQRRAVVLFSAHSLPLKADGIADYARQVRETASRIAQAAGLRQHALAWQSAGRTSQTWLGPDILDVIRQHQDSDPSRSVLICPIGFVADNLEVLYDDDIECRTLIERSGGRYLRPPMPNADADFLSCLADAIEETLRHQVDAA